MGPRKNSKICAHTYTSIYTSVRILIYCILSNGEVIKYHIFISVVVIELSFKGLNTGPEHRLGVNVNYWVS